jgi:hypothetical protein
MDRIPLLKDRDKRRALQFWDSIKGEEFLGYLSDLSRRNLFRK